MAKLSRTSVVALAAGAGFPLAHTGTAASIAQCESGYDTTIVNFGGERIQWSEARRRILAGEKPGREISVGLWQINLYAHAPDQSPRGLVAFGDRMVSLSGRENAATAYRIWKGAGETFARDWVNCSRKLGTPGVTVTPVNDDDAGGLGGFLQDRAVDAISGGIRGTYTLKTWSEAVAQIGSAVTSREWWERVAIAAIGVLAIIAGAVLLLRDLTVRTVADTIQEAVTP